MRRLACALLLAALSGCGGSAAPAGTAYFALSSAPTGFDPLQANMVSNGMMQRQVLETLTELPAGAAATAAPQPLLAEGWQRSADGLEWIFTLRGDARFHDPQDPPLWPGRTRALEAADVVASFVQHADPRDGRFNTWIAYDDLFPGLDELREALHGDDADALLRAAMTAGVAGIRALDARRVQLRLTRPDGFLLQRLASQAFAVIPRERAFGSAEDRRDRPIGSGPFAVARWDPGQGVVFRAVPGWRAAADLEAGDRRLPQEVRFDLVREGSARSLLFDQGRLDRLSLGGEMLAGYVADGALKPEWAARGVRLRPLELPDFNFVVFNWRDPVIGSVPGDDAAETRRRALRRALALACPSDGWLQVVRGGAGGVPVTRFLPPVVPEAAGLPEYPWRGPDLPRARAALAAAGHPDGKDLPELVFDLSGGDALSLSFGELYVQNLAAIGVRCRARPNAWEQVRERMRRGEYQFSLQSWTLDWPDAAQIYALFESAGRGGETNLAQFARADYDAALARLRASAAPEERLRLCQALDAILAEECVGVPLDHRRGYLLIQPWLDGAESQPFDPIACKHLRLGQRP